MSEVQQLFEQAKTAPSFDEALTLATSAFSLKLLGAMRASGIPKSEQTVEALRRSGLDRLLTQAVGRGRLPYNLVVEELERMRGALAKREISANELKAGILAFDEAAQRMAAVAGRGGRFQYALTQNRARDSLITFARSLHR